MRIAPALLLFGYVCIINGIPFIYMYSLNIFDLFTCISVML